MTATLDLQSQISRTGGIRHDWRPIVTAITIFSTLSIWAAIKSEGFLEADACTHYQYARFAFQQPHYFVNVWGRPICTAVYSVPAALGGRLGVRFMSLVLALGCSLVAYRIAQNERQPLAGAGSCLHAGAATGLSAFLQRTDGTAVCIPAGPGVSRISDAALVSRGVAGRAHPAQPS